MTVCGVLLRLTTWRPERRRGVFGPFQAPANSAPPVGRVKATSLAVAPLGCLVRLIPSSTPFSGVPALRRRIAGTPENGVELAMKRTRHPSDATADLVAFTRPTDGSELARACNVPTT